jgi:predicted dehydrogenase
MIKIGLLGVGHLGKIHARLINEIDELDLIGFYDPSEENARLFSQSNSIKRYESIDELIKKSDAIDIVTPTVSHYECAVKALRQSRHVFIEKPVTNTLQEARELKALTLEANVKVQVGHVERFNPAFVAARQYIYNPMFIETHRLAQFNPRGTDVAVILDLMIHDIDIVLSTVKSGVRKINASGVAVVSDTPDIANARIEFDNGCVANLTASRISMKNMRKSRFFQRDAYISVDFLKKISEIVKIKDVEEEPDPLSVILDLGKGKGQKQIYFEAPKIQDDNAIKTELQLFAKSIVTNTTPPVTIQDGYDALSVAYQVLDKLKVSSGLNI